MVASNLEFSPLPTPSSDAGTATESLTVADACGCTWGNRGLGEQDFVVADSTGCLFSTSETSASVLSEQRFFDGDGFVQDFSRLKRINKKRHSKNL